VYFEANNRITKRLAGLDEGHREKANVRSAAYATPHVVINNHREHKLEKLGIDPRELAQTHPGLVHVLGHLLRLCRGRGRTAAAST